MKRLILLVLFITVISCADKLLNKETIVGIVPYGQISDAKMASNIASGI